MATPSSRRLLRSRLSVDADGWIAGLCRASSPNADARPTGVPISLIVLHNISLPPGHFGGGDILKLFTNTLNPAAHPSYPALAQLRVSAHFVIRRSGRLVQCVSCNRRAWHAGISQWRGRQRCNDFSIGIELEGADRTPYTARQYRSLNRLLDCLCAHYPIAAITGHDVIAPDRKTDPGPAFDASRLRPHSFVDIRMKA